MITKPVSCIMNMNGLYYDSNPETLEEAMQNASNGNIIVVDKNTKRTIDVNGAKISDYPQGVIVYQKISDTKVIKAIGQKAIKKSDLHNITATNATSGQDQVIVISENSNPCGYCCDKDYGLRFEIKNDELYQQQFKNIYHEIYVVPANKCCGSDCAENATPTFSDLLVEFYKAWRENRKNSMMTARLYNGSYNTAILEDGDFSGTYTKIEFTVSASKMYMYGQINMKYMKNRVTSMIVTPFGGFDCCMPDTTNESVSPKAPQTLGYDLNQMAYDFMGWMGESPYRLSDVTLSEMGFVYPFARDTETTDLYDVLVLNYEQWSDAPWGHFQHPEQLVIADKRSNGAISASTEIVDLYKFFMDDTNANWPTSAISESNDLK